MKEGQIGNNSTGNYHSGLSGKNSEIEEEVNLMYTNGNGTDHKLPFPSTTPIATTSSYSVPCSGCEGRGFIEHPVSKLDTLAGVAIKYGVEVADIKRMNGLLTDLQMFALKTIQIPLPGRHPPSSCLSNGSTIPGHSCSEQTPPRRVHSDLFDSFQSLKLKSTQPKVTPAMSSLQGYYGLKPTERKTVSEGFEMALYRKGNSTDDQYFKSTTTSAPPFSRHRKSRSLANGFPDDTNGLAADTLPAPELLIKEDNNSGGAFSAVAGKGLALRSKATNRTSVASDGEPSGSGPATVNPMDPQSVEAGFMMVRKSSSLSNLNEQDSSSSSIWPDIAAVITRPIFDGLPKPTPSRKNKAALD